MRLQVYRTAVNYRGQCYQRLLRYRQFLAFKKKLRVRDPVPVKSEFPKKEWTHQKSLQDDVVEARQVLVRMLVSSAWCVCGMRRYTDMQMFSYDS